MRKPRLRTIVAGLVAVLVVAFGLTVATQVWLGGPLQPPQVRSAHPIVTRVEADRVRDGMSYTQVKAVVGAPGKLIPRLLSGPLPPFIPGPKDFPEYEWRNSDGSFLRVTFHRDHVTAIEWVWLQ